MSLKMYKKEVDKEGGVQGRERDSERELMKVWFLRKGASGASDDDVSGVVTCMDTLLQRFLLNQLREEP